ncbi:MAG: tetratricopeptide repeat protein [Candidatus Aureabacteria bacterium]|nr:tetratricopeptide repeat protein [Candidatus Auribacterota bacterium]
MKTAGARFHIIVGGVLISLIALCFSLACLLTTDESFTPHDPASVLGRLLGESRQAIGSSLCVEADRYFHHGVPHQTKAASMGFIQNLANEVQPRTLEHLSGGELYEMMPWLRFATRMDPHNMDAYLSAAFWVAEQENGHLPQAMDILAEARRNNPSDYRVPLQRGLILLHYGELDNAARLFDLALKLWAHTGGVNAEQKRIDIAALFNYRGLLYEHEGRTAEALACYREHLRIKPEANGVREIVRGIEEGQRSRADAERILHDLMKEKVTPDEYCRHTDDHPHTHGMHHPSLELHEH